LSRKIDVVGCGNVVRKERREEGKRKIIDVGCSNAGGKEEEEEEEEEGGCRVELHTHNGCGLGVSRFLDFVYNAEG
jgi:hypothetical protein